MSKTGEAAARSGDGAIDPDIQRFVARVTADYERLTAGRELTAVEMRSVAEQVRERWRQGGPVMARVTEHVADTDVGPVRVRIYDPGVATPSPALVYMHGGGWVLFSLDTHDRVMREYAARAGVIVVGVDYSLSPEVRYPVALEQVVAVVRWLQAHGAAHGIDARRLPARCSPPRKSITSGTTTPVAPT
ncbi:MAG: alpha/beta hydrolase fold protein [Steroidobacteraceae bacterium]|nr:alpha/beta hydrolase fold protein [Steroidobacteraceae bacterium]